jgi:hypothetical protein
MKNETSAIIGTVGIPANYGGFETIVDELAKHYCGDKNIFVYCSSLSYDRKIKKYHQFNLIYLPFRANGIQSIFYDAISILHAVYKLKSSKLLLLGVSGALLIPIIKFIRPSIVITCNIDGLEWKRAKWRWWEQKFLKFLERLSCKYSDNIISDNLHIRNHVQENYNRGSDLISCGGEHARKAKIIKIEKYIIPTDFYLKICRVEPENNVEMVLNVFSKLENQNLVFVGNWQHSDFARSIFEKFKNERNIFLIGPSYDKDEIYTLRTKCKAYVHGHSAGGTNPSLVEILHFKKMPICFRCNYNESSTFGLASYYSDEDELKEIIEHEKWRHSGNLNALFIKSRNEYNWDTISTKYFKYL